MYAYSGNDPINRIDSQGMFWKGVGDFFSDTWCGIKSLARKVFGAGNTTTKTKKSENIIISEPSPFTLKEGVKFSETITSNGDSTKPISVYTNTKVSGLFNISPFAGIKINIDRFTSNISISENGIGITDSVKVNDTTASHKLDG